MEMSTLIWNFLTSEFTDDHVVVYLYTCGNVRSPNTAIEKVMGITKTIFCPPLSEQYVRTIIKAYLDLKKKQYIRGEIKVKPIY